VLGDVQKAKGKNYHYSKKKQQCGFSDI